MSHGILHYLCLADLSKSFSQLIVSIFMFSQYFFQKIFPSGKSFSQLILPIFIFSQYFFSKDFTQWKSVGLLPHCLCQDSFIWISRINDETAFRFALFKHCVWVIVSDFILDHLVSKQLFDIAEKYPEPLQTSKMESFASVFKG